jgi:hypothetical protein
VSDEVPMARLVSDGHWQVSSDWPAWKKVCGAKKHTDGQPCQRWAVRGMPTCRLHGSGGKKNKELGMLRYMCWVITGGPQNQPVQLAAATALAVFAEAVLKQGKGTLAHQMKAAMWITELLDERDQH